MEFELNLPWVVVLASTIIVASFFLSRPSYRLVTFVLFFSIFINLAGYSFLSYNFAGQKRELAGAQILTYLAPVLLLIGSLAIMVRHSDRFREYLRQNADLLALAVVAVSSSLFSLDQLLAVQYSVWLAAAVVMTLAYFFVLGNVAQPSDYGVHIAGLFFISHTPFMLLVLPSFLQFTGRIEAVFSSKIFWAYAAAVIIPSVIVLSRRASRQAGLSIVVRIPWLVQAAVTVLSSAALLLSAKRNPIVATALVFVVFILFGTRTAERKGFKTGLRLGILIVGLGIVLWQLSPTADRTWDRFAKTANEEENTSVQARQEILENGLDVLRRFPVFGVGIGNGRLAIMKYHPYDETSGLNLHSTPLGVLVETGIVGFVIFVIVAIRSVYLVSRTSSGHFRVDWILLAIPPSLVSITEYNLTPGQALFWPLLMVIVAPRILLLGPNPRGPSRP